MDWSTIIGIVGGLASIVSVPFAIYQTLINRKLKDEQRRNIWQRIETTKSMMRALDEEQLDFAYGLTVEQFRTLFREAVLLEDKFSLETINKWRKIGKISSDWQQKNAMILLKTNEITEGIEVDEKFSINDNENKYNRQLKKTATNSENESNPKNH